MLTDKFVEFTIKDLSFDEETKYTKEDVEDKTQDKFVAMRLDENGFPIYIWTENYVLTVLGSERLMGELHITVAERNPRL